MKKKMIGLLICLLLVATIPIAAGMTVNDGDNTGTTALKKTFIIGLITNPVVTGRTITFRALWCHYRVLGGGQKGTITMQKVIVENQGMFKVKGNTIMGLFDGELIIK